MFDKNNWKKIGDDQYEGRKCFVAENLKVEGDNSNTYIEGYVNTKGQPDSYGDIPTGDNVYDTSRYGMNSVLLLDHVNSGSKIAGSAQAIREDKNGLFMRFKLMKNPVSQDVAHAIQAVKEGLLKTFSIGGRWEYDKKNPSILTKAHIHEVSLVAVPADPRAIGEASKKIEDQKDINTLLDCIGFISGEFRKSNNKNFLKVINFLSKN